MQRLGRSDLGEVGSVFAGIGVGALGLYLGGYAFDIPFKIGTALAEYGASMGIVHFRDLGNYLTPKSPEALGAALALGMFSGLGGLFVGSIAGAKGGYAAAQYLLNKISKQSETPQLTDILERHLQERGLDKKQSQGLIDRVINGGSGTELNNGSLVYNKDEGNALYLKDEKIAAFGRNPFGGYRIESKADIPNEHGLKLFFIESDDVNHSWFNRVQINTDEGAIGKSERICELKPTTWQSRYELKVEGSNLKIQHIIGGIKETILYETSTGQFKNVGATDHHGQYVFPFMAQEPKVISRR